MSLMMIRGIFEDFDKVKCHHLASNSNFIFKLWRFGIIIHAYSKEKNHGDMDRISYPRFVRGFEGIGWEKSGSVITICLYSYSKNHVYLKRFSPHLGWGLFTGVEVEK